MRDTLEKLLRAGQAELVLEEAERYFAQVAGGDPDAPWVALRAVQAAGQLRAWGQAVTWVERAWRAQPAEPEIVGWLHFYCGTALTYIGDLYRAEEELNKFRGMAPLTPKLRWFSGDVLFNLAYVKRILKQTQHEIDLFKEAAHAYANEGRSGEVPGCWYEIAWCLLLSGAASDARPYLDKVCEGLEQSSEPGLDIKLEIAEGLFYRLTGDLDRSNHVCHALSAKVALVPEQVADCQWILACNALQIGDQAGAAMHAEEAYRAAVTHWWPPQLERINGLKTEIGRMSKVGR